jgi:hypothetical protein
MVIQKRALGRAWSASPGLTFFRAFHEAGMNATLPDELTARPTFPYVWLQVGTNVAPSFTLSSPQNPVKTEPQLTLYYASNHSVHP